MGSKREEITGEVTGGEAWLNKIRVREPEFLVLETLPPTQIPTHSHYNAAHPPMPALEISNKNLNE
jgi:hypothetical protein